MEKIIFNSDIFKSNTSIYFLPKGELGFTLYKEELREVSVSEILNKVNEYCAHFCQDPSVIMLPVNVQFELSTREVYGHITEFNVLIDEVINKDTKVLFYVQDDIKDRVSIPK